MEDCSPSWSGDLMDERDNVLSKVALRQGGLVTRTQADEAGLTRHGWAHRVRRGDWLLIAPSVWLRAGAPCDERTLALGSVLACGNGAALGFESAAAVWGVPGFRLWPLHVSAPRSPRSGWSAPELSTPPAAGSLRSGELRVSVHRPTAWPAQPTGVIDGLAVVRPALLLLQLAPLVHPERLQRILDKLWSRHLLSGPSVAAELAPMMVRGRPGVVAVRELLGRCGPDYVPPESNLERRLIDIVESAGLPTLRRQVNLGDDDRWIGRVDLYWEQWLIIVEVDSDKFHLALSDRAADDARQRALERTGYLVVRVTEFELWHRRDLVIERLRQAIGSRR